MGRSIVPTVEADILYPKAAAILEELHNIESEITAASESVSGRIIMAASTIPSSYILPRLAAEFSHTYPEVSFEIRTYDSFDVSEKISQGEILLGMTGARANTQKLVFDPFSEDTLVLAAAKTRAQKSVTLEQLLKLPFIVREEGSGTRKSIEKFLAQHNISLEQLNINATFGSSAAIVEAVKADLGVSILSRHAVHDGIQHGQIVTIPISDLSMQRNFYIVTPAKRSLPYHYRVFLRFLKHR